MTKCKGIMNDKRSQYSIMNDIVSDRKGHNIVKDGFAHNLTCSRNLDNGEYKPPI